LVAISAEEYQKIRKTKYENLSLNFLSGRKGRVIHEGGVAQGDGYSLFSKEAGGLLLSSFMKQSIFLSIGARVVYAIRCHQSNQVVLFRSNPPVITLR
jgi:hypothetical protein